MKPNDILVEFGFGSGALDPAWKVPWTSIIIHHLLRQLPSKIVSAYVFEILEIFELIKDISLNQHLNYRLLGLKLCESPPHEDYVESILNRVMQVLSQYNHLEEYLVVANAYLDIILQRSMEHFMALYELLSGISQNEINLHILEKATRSDSISDPTTIQMLFEISKALHDSIDSIDILNDDYQRKSQLICYFVRMISFGDDRERHLTFLVTCRSAFSYFDMIMDTLVLLSNNLAIGAMKGTNKFSSFVRACVAFSEVTIPFIPNQLRCMKLFIATAEVALFAGLFSHNEGLLNSAVDCLLCLDVPGINGGIAQIQMSLMSIIENQPWTSSRTRTKLLCAIISLCACLSQRLLSLPSNNMKAVGHNEMMFFGDESYEQELSSVTREALQRLFEAIEQDTASASKGKLALEACNCLITNFKANHELHLKCSKLIEIASSCLHSKDNYLNTSVNLFNKHFENL